MGSTMVPAVANAVDSRVIGELQGSGLVFKVRVQKKTHTHTAHSLSRGSLTLLVLVVVVVVVAGYLVGGIF